MQLTVCNSPTVYPAGSDHYHTANSYNKHSANSLISFPNTVFTFASNHTANKLHTNVTKIFLSCISY